jgi:hypothetical protein
VPHDGNSCGVLDGPHERIAPAWDDEIDVPILREQGGHLRACLDGLHERGWEGRARERCLNRASERRGGACGFFAALEDRSVAWVRFCQCESVMESGGDAPDLRASAATFTTTSGRASKMTRSTPIGHEMR